MAWWRTICGLSRRYDNPASGSSSNKPVANDLDEEEALRTVINALRADNGRLLRLLIAGAVGDGRTEHKELIEVLARHPKLRNWLGAGE